jgi:predicted MFS family arabinose efflux permease
LLLPFIAAELHLSFSQVGFLKGVFSASMSLVQFPLSLLGERIGELPVIAALMVLITLPLSRYLAQPGRV